MIKICTFYVVRLFLYFITDFYDAFGKYDDHSQYSPLPCESPFDIITTQCTLLYYNYLY